MVDVYMFFHSFFNVHGMYCNCQKKELYNIPARGFDNQILEVYYRNSDHVGCRVTK